MALRLEHPALALQAGLLQLIPAALFWAHSLFAPYVASDSLLAFAHLGFWTPVVIGLSALLCSAWIHRQAPRIPWCQSPTVQWLTVVWGLLWWVTALLTESTRVLELQGQHEAIPAAWVAVVLVTSALATWIAQHRQWRLKSHHRGGW